MAIRRKYSVTTYSVTMLAQGFGWIFLAEGDKKAGFIYFVDATDVKDRFGDEASDHPYVVTHQPIRLWSTFLDILRNELPLYIEGYQDDAGEVTAFFGTAEDEPVGEGEGSMFLSLAAEGRKTIASNAYDAKR